jgi:hypothetical protein
MPSIGLIFFIILMVGLSIVPIIFAAEIPEVELAMTREPDLFVFYNERKNSFKTVVLLSVLGILIILIIRKLIFNTDWISHVIIPICILIIMLILIYKISQLYPSKKLDPTLSKR